MHEAFHGFPNEVSGLANCLIDAPAVAIKKKLQGRIMPLILAELYPIDPVQLLLSRLALWLPPACLSELEAFQLQDSMKAIRTSPQHMRFVVLKTWCNGWTTDARAAQFAAPCIFCACPRDALSHIISCPRLWEPVLNALHLPRRMCALSNLCLGPVGADFKNRLIALYAAFDIYHGHKNASATNLSSRVKSAVRLATARLAHVHDFLSTQANLEIEGGFQR